MLICSLTDSLCKNKHFGRKSKESKCHPFHITQCLLGDRETCSFPTVFCKCHIELKQRIRFFILLLPYWLLAAETRAELGGTPNTGGNVLNSLSWDWSEVQRTVQDCRLADVGMPLVTVWDGYNYSGHPPLSVLQHLV